MKIFLIIFLSVNLLVACSDNTESNASDGSYSVSRGLEGSLENTPLPQNGKVVERVEWQYFSEGKSYSGYRWVIATEDSYDDVEAYYDAIIPSSKKETFMDETSYIIEKNDAKYIKVLIDRDDKYIAIDELYKP